jgi:hypothetical protein
MKWLNRLPGFRRSAPGLEWTLWQRLPAILGWGTVPPLAAALALWLTQPGNPAVAADGGRLLAVYALIGFVVLHWTLVLTLAIGCAIVIVMKGPAYVADAYPPPGRDGSAPPGPGTDRM